MALISVSYSGTGRGMPKYANGAVRMREREIRDRLRGMRKYSVQRRITLCHMRLLCCSLLYLRECRISHGRLQLTEADGRRCGCILPICSRPM